MKLTDKLYFYSERGMLDCNTYVVRDSTTVLVDPGLTQFLPEKVKELKKDGIDPAGISVIANTHLHLDHWWANEALKELSGARILAHPQQKRYYDVTVTETSRLFGMPGKELKEDGLLEESRWVVGSLEFELIPSPGHSPDSICFYCRKEKFLICGDVVFDRNTGRVDLPGGSATELKKSIENLAKLEIEYLLPGHVGIVRGLKEVQNNFDLIREQVFPWL